MFCCCCSTESVIEPYDEKTLFFKMHDGSLLETKVNKKNKLYKFKKGMNDVPKYEKEEDKLYFYKQKIIYSMEFMRSKSKETTNYFNNYSRMDDKFLWIYGFVPDDANIIDHGYRIETDKIYITSITDCSRLKMKRDMF
jgi:hypothetical protein